MRQSARLPLGGEEQRRLQRGASREPGCWIDSRGMGDTEAVWLEGEADALCDCWACVCSEGKLCVVVMGCAG